MKKFFFVLICLFFESFALANYPAHWWKKIEESERQGSWEILPQEARRGEVVLSKRNELGIFSNLAYTPFTLDGVSYASVEGLWQMMKYPDLDDSDDIRNHIAYPFTRDEVRELSGFDAKKAGDEANRINKLHKIFWISYGGNKFDYKDHAQGSEYHYQIIAKAIKMKVEQNPDIKNLLMKTKGLKLIPDHHQSPNSPPSYFYHKILMEIRDQ